MPSIGAVKARKGAHKPLPARSFLPSPFLPHHFTPSLLRRLLAQPMYPATALTPTQHTATPPHAQPQEEAALPLAPLPRLAASPPPCLPNDVPAAKSKASSPAPTFATRTASRRPGQSIRDSIRPRLRLARAVLAGRRRRPWSPLESACPVRFPAVGRGCCR